MRPIDYLRFALLFVALAYALSHAVSWAGQLLGVLIWSGRGYTVIAGGIATGDVLEWVGISLVWVLGGWLLMFLLQPLYPLWTAAAFGAYAALWALSRSTKIEFLPDGSYSAVSFTAWEWVGALWALSCGLGGAWLWRRSRSVRPR
jgi:hypothetical protein